MGIGGAVLYSVAFMTVHALPRVSAAAVRSVRWFGRVFLNGATLRRANVTAVRYPPAVPEAPNGTA